MRNILKGQAKGLFQPDSEKYFWGQFEIFLGTVRNLFEDSWKAMMTVKNIWGNKWNFFLRIVISTAGNIFEDMGKILSTMKNLSWGKCEKYLGLGNLWVKFFDDSEKCFWQRVVRNIFGNPLLQKIFHMSSKLFRTRMSSNSKILFTVLTNISFVPKNIFHHPQKYFTCTRMLSKIFFIVLKLERFSLSKRFFTVLKRTLLVP